MYPSIVRLVETELAIIQRNYDAIMEEKSDREFKSIQMKQLIQDIIFIDIKNLIKEL